MSKCGPRRGSRQAVQVGGTCVVGGGIDGTKESMEVVFSWSDGRWLIVDVGLGGEACVCVGWKDRSMQKHLFV